jgi:hypothetical protein
MSIEDVKRECFGILADVTMGLEGVYDQMQNLNDQVRMVNSKLGHGPIAMASEPWFHAAVIFHEQVFEAGHAALDNFRTEIGKL